MGTRDSRWPTLDCELELASAGHTYIAGLDEAGRGAWAGPVGAAAVVLPLHRGLGQELDGVRDSKLCTPRQRSELYDRITRVAIAWAVSLVPARRIDQIGIVPATRQAMHEAIAQLTPAPDALLIDALDLPEVALPQRAIKRGDQLCLSIASASILAKVTRDRAMCELANELPAYGFAAHKGYGTRQHRQALCALGPTHIHRWYFAPVADIARQRGLSPCHPVLPKEPHVCRTH